MKIYIISGRFDLNSSKLVCNKCGFYIELKKNNMYSLSGSQELLLALATSTLSLCLNFCTIWTTSIVLHQTKSLSLH